MFLRRFVPESPRWLVTHARQTEAEDTVRDIETRVKRDSGRDLPEPENRTLKLHPKPHIGLLPIFKAMLGRFRARSGLAVVPMTAQAFLFNAVFFTYGLVLAKFYGVPNERTGLYILPLAAGNFLSPIVIGPLFDSIGRRRMITPTYGLSGALLAAVRPGPPSWPGQACRSGSSVFHKLSCKCAIGPDECARRLLRTVVRSGDFMYAITRSIMLAGSLLGLAHPASAAVLSTQLNVQASGFGNVTGTDPVPTNPYALSFRLTFDPTTTDQFDSATGIVLTSSSRPIAGGLVFDYDRSLDELTVGGALLGAGGLAEQTDDVFATITDPFAAAPTLEQFDYTSSASAGIFETFSGSVTATPVPEPGTTGLLLTCLGLVLLVRRSRIWGAVAGLVATASSSGGLGD